MMTHNEGQKLYPTTKTITKALFEKTNSRGKFVTWVQTFNNCLFAGYTKNGWARIKATPFVVDGPNGLRANGFFCICTGEDGYVVRRGLGISVEEENKPGKFSKSSKKMRVFYTCGNKDCKDTHVVQMANIGEEPPLESCGKCGSTKTPKILTSYYSAKGHVCNSSCMNAVGPVCVCGCGGANHGKGHMH